MRKNQSQICNPIDFYYHYKHFAYQHFQSLVFMGTVQEHVVPCVVLADPWAFWKTVWQSGTHRLSWICAARLSSPSYVADEALSNLSDRYKMSQTARGVHIHTPGVKCKSNKCAQLQIIPSGQINVFRDEQVAVEDRAKASEWSLDILTNPF